MDVSELLTRGADFGKHTGLVKALAREVERLTKLEKTLKASIRRTGRVPVLVVCDPTGEFNVYADWKANVEVVHTPKDTEGWRGKDRTLVEQYVDSVIPKEHAAIHLPSLWVAGGGPQACRTLAFLQKKVNDQATLRVITEVQGMLKEKA